MKFFKYTPCLDSMLLYELQSFEELVHAMLEYIQQAGITFEMPVPYKLACTHRCETQLKAYHSHGVVVYKQD